MKTILRYELMKEINDIELPREFKVLSVGTTTDENGKEVISLWITCDVNDETKRPHNNKIVRFCVFGTGANLDDLTNFDYRYIGTVQKRNEYAFHVFVVLD